MSITSSDETTAATQPTQPATPIRRIFATYPVTLFFTLAMILQIIATLTQYYNIRNYGLGFLRPFSPAICALIVAGIGQGWKKSWSFVTSLFKVKVHPKYYFFALLYPSFVGLLALGILRAVGAVHEFHLDLEGAKELDFFILSIKVASSEEIAWVGFLLTIYATRYRLFQAAVITGLFWGVWYIPLVIADIQVAPGLPIIPLLLNFGTIAAICAWLYIRTRSAFAVFLMQLTTNYSSQTIPVLPLRGGIPQYVTFVLIKCLFAAALFIFWGPKPMFGRQKAGTSSLDDASLRPAAAAAAKN